MKIKFTLLALAISFFASAQTLTTGTAINKAGKQRMLCMRMAKNYVAIGAGIKVDVAMAELDESVSTFNENYNDLMAYAKNKETKDALETVGAQWNKFRLKVLATPELDNANTIISDVNTLVIACNIVVDKIVLGSGSKAAVLPNICGKQRLLSQKMALLYFANYWNVPYPTLVKEMDDTINNFEINLNVLSSTVLNTDEINGILKLQKDEWEFLKKSFDLTASNKMPASVFSGTNVLVKNFDRTTALYEKIVN